MKKHIKAISAILLSLAALAACNKETVVESYITPDITSLTEVDAQDPSPVAIMVKTNTKWMVLDIPAWVTVEPKIGYGDAIITVTPDKNFRNENTETEARSASFRIIGNANSAAHNTGVSVKISIAQKGFTPEVDPDASIGGIPSLEEFLAFADAVSNGGSSARWLNEAGEVELLADIDLSSVNEWTPIGLAKLGSSVKGDPTVDTFFKGVFNGGGHKITGINWTFKLGAESTYTACGLFGAVQNATIKNLVLGKEGDSMTLGGSPAAPCALGALAGTADGLTVTGVTNNVDVWFIGDEGRTAEPQFALAGIVARGDRCVIGGEDAASAVVNNGDVAMNCKNLFENAGEGGHMVGGIMGYMHYGSIIGAKNYGMVSCPSGRGGGIVASINNGVNATDFALVKACVNYGTVRRDAFGNGGVTSNAKRMGGIFGGAEGWFNLIEDCVNEGNVFSEYLCRCGGCCGHSKIQVKGFENKGVILSDKDDSHGPGWISGYFDTYANAQKSGVVNIAQCKMGGKVGGWSDYKDNPDGAPAASMDNVLHYNNVPGTTYLEEEIIK